MVSSQLPPLVNFVGQACSQCILNLLLCNDVRPFLYICLKILAPAAQLAVYIKASPLLTRVISRQISGVAASHSWWPAA